MARYSGHIGGNLDLRPGDDASGVTGIEGGVWVYSPAHIELPACESVGSDVRAGYDARIELPSCPRAAIAGDVLVDPGARVVRKGETAS